MEGIKQDTAVKEQNPSKEAVMVWFLKPFSCAKDAKDHVLQAQVWTPGG